MATHRSEWSTSVRPRNNSPAVLEDRQPPQLGHSLLYIVFEEQPARPNGLMLLPLLTAGLLHF